MKNGARVAVAPAKKGAKFDVSVVNSIATFFSHFSNELLCAYCLLGSDNVLVIMYLKIVLHHLS